MSPRAQSPALQVEQLEDRLNPAGSMIPAGQFNWMQYSPTGELAELVWSGNTLVYRERVAGAWVDTAITTNNTFTSAEYDTEQQVEDASRTAQLVFTSDGTPNALVLDKQWNGTAGGYQTVIDDYARTAAGWQLVNTIEPNWLSQWGPNTLVAAAGPNNAIDLVFTETSVAATGVGNFGSGTLYYATNASGTWTFSTIAQTADLNTDVWETGARWAPRYISLAVDANNNAYVSYTPEFYIAAAFSTVDSTLMYATNAGGSWSAQVVQAPINGTPADAGLGASIAVGPSGQVAIASLYVSRYSTGSPEDAELMYHTLVNGQWTSTVVTAAPDGYVAADGPNFTGFAPDLSFNSAGEPVIVFEDVAGQHLPVTYSNVFAGQIRVATLSGSTWNLQTVLSQTDPIENQLLYPVAATYNGQTTYAALQAVTTVDSNLNPISTVYSMLDLNAPSGAAPAPVVAPSQVASPPPVAPPPAPAAAPAVVPAAAPVQTPATPTGYAVVEQTGTSPTQVLVYRPDGSVQMVVTPFGGSYFGSVRIAQGDVLGNGVVDLITVTGPGVQSRIRVWDGQTGAMLEDIEVFPGFLGGLYVATGDVLNAGYDDIAVGADQGLQPHVDVFDGRSQALLASFFAYAPGFVGGVRLAVGDVSGNGYDDIVTAPGYGAGAHITVFSGQAIAQGSGPVHLADFYAFDPAMIAGVNIAVANIAGTKNADIIVAPSVGSSHVVVISGSDLMNGMGVVDLTSMFAWPNDGSGVQLEVSDVDGNGTQDLVLASTNPDNGQIGVFAPPALVSNNPAAVEWLDPLPGLTTSVYVGG